MKIEDLTIRKLIEICDERIGCLDCPLNKAYGEIKIALCAIPIKAIKDMEVDIYE